MRAERLLDGAKALPHFVVGHSESAMVLFAKVSPILHHFALFFDGNGELMRGALQCGGGRGRVLTCARAVCANFS